MQEEISSIQEEIMLDRLQSLQELAFIKHHVQQLFRAPLVSFLYRLIEVKLRFPSLHMLASRLILHLFINLNVWKHTL